MFNFLKKLFAKQKPVEQPAPTIKGNITSKGKKVYHVPGGNLYDATNAEQMFYTEEEAIAAGYTKSKK